MGSRGEESLMIKVEWLDRAAAEGQFRLASLAGRMSQIDRTRGTSPCAAGPSLSNQACRGKPRVLGNYQSGSSNAHKVCRPT